MIHCRLERVAGIEPVSYSLEGCLVTITLPAFIGPDGGTRTHDLRYPKPSRYQTALHPDETLLRGLNPRAGEERE